MCPRARAFCRSGPVASLPRLLQKRRGLCCFVLLCVLAGTLLGGCGQGVRVQPRGQAQMGVGVGR